MVLFLKCFLFICCCWLTVAPTGLGAHVHPRVPGKERVEDAWNSMHYKDGEHQDNFDHEAVLGSKEKAQEFDDLTPDEAKRRLAVLVTKGGMDADGDGFVDREELIQWVLTSFKDLAEEDGAERFEDEDVNRDGFVTWEEHLRENFDDSTEAEDDMIVEDQAFFKAADIDGNSLLDKTEFPAFNSPEEYEFMHETLYQLTMTRRDKNKDGLLDLFEFLVDDNGNLPDPKSENHVSEKERFQKDYDVDKDGKLSKKEVFLWIVPDNREMAEQEADHLIVSSDDDGDGKLSVTEIVNHHDVFVGSEATDFGERLNQLRDEL